MSDTRCPSPATGASLAAPSAPLLEVRHVSRNFAVTRGLLRRQAGLVRAVDDVSLHVGHGETLGLVGESGCGKSTLARLIMGLLPADSGEILFEGQKQTPGSRNASLQMVFQDPFSSLNPRLNIGASVGEPLLTQHVPAAERRARVAQALARVGLAPELAARYPHEFSGGQRQRVAIARALVTGPRFVVCDEAVSALDASVQAQVLNLLRDLQTQHQLAYLFISHDLAVVGHMADRVAVMYLGRLVEIAPRAMLFGSAAHPYTQALLAAVPARRPVPGPRFVLRGDLPSPLAPPGGCAFHPRCSHAIARCQNERPPLRELAPGHAAACHLAGQFASAGPLPAAGL